jgi:hypothetical protein
MDGISLNELYPLLSTSASGKTSASVTADTAFYDVFNAQLSSGSVFGASEEDGLFSGTNSSSLPAMMALLSTLSNKEENDIGGSLQSFLMLLSSGVSGAGLGAAVASISSALKNAPEGSLESIRSALLSSAYSRGVLTQANDALFSSNTSDANYPFNASKAVNPLVKSDVTNRSAALYNNVIAQFKVASNPRYAVTESGSTYCNIFMWDVTRAMGAEIPHYVDPNTLEARSYPDVTGARELNANGIYDWLSKKGGEYGWKRVTAAQAQALANEGRPVVTAWKNTTGGHGHVQVVVPSMDGAYNENRGVAIAQAGRRLFDYGYIRDVYNESLHEVVYYAHA